MKTFLNSSTVLAQASIFSALVGPRINLAPEDGNGSAGATGGAGGGEGAGGTSGSDGGGAAGGNAGAAPAGGTGGDGDAGTSLLGQAAAAGKEPGKEGEPAKPAGDPKPEGEPKKEGQQAADDGAPKDVDGKAIPETYEIKMPDGVEMDAELMAEVTPLFREAKLSPAQAQVVADAYMRQQTKALEAHSKQVAAWANEARADKEFGGKDFNANMAHATKAFQAFGSERALQIFDTYGLGNNPEVLRMFVRIGKAIGEGRTVLGGGGGDRVSAARDMYPSMYQG